VSVYATARGPLARLADPLAARARARRHAQFLALTGVSERTRIVDVGCGALGLRALGPALDVTGVDLVDRPSYPGPFVRADATEGLPFDDGAFDLAYCSSVVEHVAPARRAALAAELVRVTTGGLWVQTPARSFPVEPHALLPAAHWLPVGLRRRYWRLGVAPWEEIHLLGRRELAALFPAARVVPERLGPVVKSWVAVRAPVPST
jgi:SAM-dependent methyltransferase